MSAEPDDDMPVENDPRSWALVYKRRSLGSSTRGGVIGNGLAALTHAVLDVADAIREGQQK